MIVSEMNVPVGLNNSITAADTHAVASKKLPSQLILKSFMLSLLQRGQTCIVIAPPLCDLPIAYQVQDMFFRLPTD